MLSLVVLYESLDVRNIVSWWHGEVKMYNMVVRIINSFFMILKREHSFAPNNHLFCSRMFYSFKYLNDQVTHLAPCVRLICSVG